MRTQLRLQSLVLAGLFITLWAIYLHGLNPAFRTDDSPETAASCYTLGIQHPPGYPLHSLMGRIATFVPLGTPAFRVNLMAAFFGAAACCTLLLALLLWLQRRWPETKTLNLWVALFAALCLGLSPTFGSQALAAKGGIYTSHAWWISLLILSLALWAKQPSSQRYAALSLLCFFVSFGNHWETQALLGPAVLAWLWVHQQPQPLKKIKILPARKWLWGMGLALAGISLYAYLPLRARLHPAMNWGAPDTWLQFKWVVLRQEYLDIEIGFLKSLVAALTGKGLWTEVATNWSYVQRQGLRLLSHLLGPHADLGWPLAALSIWGAISMTRQRKLWARESAFMLIWISAFSFITTFYFHLKPEMLWIMDVFLIPLYLAQTLLLGLGTRELLSRINRPNIGKWAWALPLIVFSVLLPLRQTRLSQAQHYWAWDFGQNFLMSLKPGAIVFAEGDFNTMPIYYLQHVKQERKDVAHLTTIFLSTPWGVQVAKRNLPDLGLTADPQPRPDLKVGDGALLRQAYSQIFSANLGRRPIYSAHFRQVQLENVREMEAGLSPSGLVMEYGAPTTLAQEKRRQGLLKAMVYRYLPQDQTQYEPSPAFALSNYGTAWLEYANYLKAQGKIKEAGPYYQRAIEITSAANRAEAWVHWGIALSGQGDMTGAIEKFEQSLKSRPIFEAYANLSGAYNQLKRYPEAERAAQAAIQLNSQNGQTWNNYAIALYYQNRQAEAMKALETALRYNPQDANIQNNLRALRGSPK